MKLQRSPLSQLVIINARGMHCTSGTFEKRLVVVNFAAGQLKRRSFFLFRRFSSNHYFNNLFLIIYGIHKLKPGSPLMLYLIITASNPVSMGFQGRKSQGERERNIDKDIDI